MRAYINGDVLFFESVEDLIVYMKDKKIIHADCCIGEDTHFTIIL